MVGTRCKDSSSELLVETRAINTVSKPLLDPDVADVVPDAPILTDYDDERLPRYIRLLDAAAEDANWREAARAKEWCLSIRESIPSDRPILLSWAGRSDAPRASRDAFASLLLTHPPADTDNVDADAAMAGCRRSA